MVSRQTLSPEEIEVIAKLVTEGLAARMEQLLSPAKSRLVSREEMAKIANISLPMLDRLVRADEIPSLQVKSRRLFDPDACIEAMKKGGKN